MSAKLFYLLQELKDNYSKNTLDEVLDVFSNEFIVQDLHIDETKSKGLLNGQSKEFYNALAISFVRDLTEFPQNYFLFWEPILYMLHERTLATFLEASLVTADNSDAADYISGIIELENGKPEIALFYFNRIDDYICCYFIGLCYLELENSENAIKNYNLFLKIWSEFADRINISTNGKMNFLENTQFIITKWNVHNDQGYLYNRVNDYKNAVVHYQQSIELVSLEENFQVNYTQNEDQADDFTIFINNYLWSLEKTGQYNKCLDLLKFVTSKLPSNIYYAKQKEKFLEKINNASFADSVIRNLFKVKTPFDISSFQTTKLISKEKSLEDLIVEQIKYGFRVFNKDLEIFQNDEIYGRQYYIQSVNGILDLLLIDKENDVLYVVELKRNNAGTEVVEQIEKYMQGLSHELKREVKGIICVHKSDQGLRDLVKLKPDIELFTYQFEFKQA